MEAYAISKLHSHFTASTFHVETLHTRTTEICHTKTLRGSLKKKRQLSRYPPDSKSHVLRLRRGPLAFASPIIVHFSVFYTIGAYQPKLGAVFQRSLGNPKPKVNRKHNHKP